MRSNFESSSNLLEENKIQEPTRENETVRLESESSPDDSMEKLPTEGKKLSAEETLKNLEDARTKFSEKKFARDSAWQKIRKVLGGNFGTGQSDLELVQMKEEYNKSLADHIQARMEGAENLPDEERAELAKELFIFKQEEARRLFDEGTEAKAKKNGSSALMNGIGKVGGWLTSNETGKNLLKGIGLAGTIYGGAVSIIRRAINESPKIAMKMGANKEGAVVKGLEKISGASKFLTPMGVGTAAAGWIEKWQKSLQESHQERNLKKIGEMSPEEQMMKLTDFNKTTYDKLMGVLTSKKTALVLGGLAGLAFVMATGDVTEAMAGDGIGHFNFGGVHEHIQNSVQATSEFSADHVFTEADMAKGNLDEQMAGKIGDLENKLGVNGTQVEQHMETASSSIPENLPVHEDINPEFLKVSNAAEAPVAQEQILSHQQPEAHNNVAGNKQRGIKSGKVEFGSSHKIPDAPLHHQETVQPAFEQPHHAPAAETVAHNQHPAQSEAAHQQTASPKHVEETQQRVAENNAVESTPKQANVHGEKHVFHDKQPNPEDIPFNQHKGFDIARIIPNVPGAEKVSIEVLKANPIFAEKIERAQEAAHAYFGEAANARPGESWKSLTTRWDRMAAVKKISADRIFNRVI